MIAKELAKEVAEIAGLPLFKAELVVKAVRKAMAKALQNKQRVEIRGFGSFRLSYRPPHKVGHNIKRLHDIGIAYTAPKYRVCFRPSLELKSLLYHNYKGPQ